jgi:hypothetical protein
MPSYATDIPKYGISNVCPDPEPYYSNDQLLAKFPNGVGSDSLLPDPSTGRISSDVISAYVVQIQGSGIIKRRPTQRVGDMELGGTETNMDALVSQDAALFNQLRLEYCYYEQRYRYALTQFLTLATSRNQSDNAPAQTMLSVTKTLNLRLNSVLEIMNFLAQERVVQVNMNKADINATNASINSKLGKLQQSYNFLSRDDAIVQTQKEMVRYTQEKNSYTSNQVAIWTTLNIIAIGAIVYVYRN